MTVEVDEDFQWSYTGDGITTTFSYTSRIFADTDLQVRQDGVLIDPPLTGYSVTGVGELSGGNVVYDTAPAAGVVVFLVKDVPILQDLDEEALGSFPAEENEKALDRAIIIAGQLDRRIDRSVRQPDEDIDPIDPVPIAADRRGKVAIYADTATADPDVTTITVAQIEGLIDDVAAVDASVTAAANSANAASSSESNAAASAAAAAASVIASLQKASNLSDVTSAATAFSNIKQAATAVATGVVELATDAETVTGTDTIRAVTPANLTAKMASPGAFGVTVPAAITGTTITANTAFRGTDFGSGSTAAVNYTNTATAAQDQHVFKNGGSNIFVISTANTVSAAGNYIRAVANIAGGGTPYLEMVGADAAIPFAVAAKGGANINFYTGGPFTNQVLGLVHAASADRYVTITGSNGGNPGIATSAGSLSINSLLALTNQTVNADAAAVSTNSVSISVNGTAYKFLVKT